MALPVRNQSPRRSGALLDQLARRMRLRGESALAQLGLRPRHLLALTVLRDRHGSTQQALSATLTLDRANVVGLLNELEADGLVERHRSPEDRRRHVVRLTDAGAQRLADAEFALSGAEDDVLGVLDEAQRETLYELLRTAACAQLGESSADGSCVTDAESCVADAEPCVADARSAFTEGDSCLSDPDGATATPSDIAPTKRGVPSS
ncbi:transcriptional regulator, MarR family [Actinacidiphila yanglinensis]|uniref:Transcriptional regulator, MarR family n=1 Tax=Actinacidiphila yanglinensis TaxID=310779 RepID=A0A1H6AIW3_9ACTN|nr:MarR family winged helix-turn-helix transcriptional regulator [Actinacidiphila yanglinensis]SEG48190.1 transcriptional regulator, MarR family [Actinacidiphila yanglinensis]